MRFLNLFIIFLAYAGSVSGADLKDFLTSQEKAQIVNGQYTQELAKEVATRFIYDQIDSNANLQNKERLKLQVRQQLESLQDGMREIEIYYAITRIANNLRKADGSFGISISIPENECDACFGDINFSDFISPYPCEHIFHPHCVEIWRTRFLEREQEEDNPRGNEYCPKCKRDRLAQEAINVDLAAQQRRVQAQLDAERRESAARHQAARQEHLDATELRRIRQSQPSNSLAPREPNGHRPGRVQHLVARFSEEPQPPAHNPLRDQRQRELDQLAAQRRACRFNNLQLEEHLNNAALATESREQERADAALAASLQAEENTIRQNQRAQEAADACLAAYLSTMDLQNRHRA